MALLSVIVPVYNEEPALRDIVGALMKSSCSIEREWLFIDDKSSDGSLAVLKDLAAQHGFRVIAQDHHAGKGAAVTRGIREAQGDWIVIQDADFEYDPAEIPMLVQPLIDGKADVVYGSRFKHNTSQVHRTYHYYVNRILTILSNLFSGIYLTDMETCYKVFRADLLKSMNLTSRRFGIEVEMTAYVAKVRARVYELPISYYPRTSFEGKKINWKDGLAALYHLVYFNCFVSRSQAFPHLPERYDPARRAGR